jgi:hypothetical protein
MLPYFLCHNVPSMLIKQFPIQTVAKAETTMSPNPDCTPLQWIFALRLVIEKT